MERALTHARRGFSRQSNRPGPPAGMPVQAQTRGPGAGRGSGGAPPEPPGRWRTRYVVAQFTGIPAGAVAPLQNTPPIDNDVEIIAVRAGCNNVLGNGAFRAGFARQSGDTILTAAAINNVAVASSWCGDRGLGGWQNPPIPLKQGSVMAVFLTNLDAVNPLTADIVFVCRERY